MLWMLKDDEDQGVHLRETDDDGPLLGFLDLMTKDSVPTPDKRNSVPGGTTTTTSGYWKRLIQSTTSMWYDPVHQRPTLAASAAVVLFVLCVMYDSSRRRRQNRPSNTKARPLIVGGADGSISRPRLASRDGASTKQFVRKRTRSADDRRAFGNRKRTSTEELPGILEDLAAAEMEETIATSTITPTNVVVLGPTVPSLVYDTWTPPPRWSEASRKVLPIAACNTRDIQRKLALQLANNENSSSPATLVISPRDSSSEEEKETTIVKNEDHNDTKYQSTISVPLQDLSFHVKPPLEGGVLELYIKDTPKEEWMEHTFASAQAAAQFQQDVLGYQVVGEQILHMYSALELIQKGSMTHDGQELVLHDKELDMMAAEEQEKQNTEDAGGVSAPKPSATATVGVAWDDVMRCLSSLPPVRAILLEQERIVANDVMRQAENIENPLTSTLLVDSYVNKRLLLGQVDFFRLFVPALPKTALPNNESNPERTEQLLRWRKRVARAAVLVRSYVKARRIVNLGWKLPVVDEPQQQLGTGEEAAAAETTTSTSTRLVQRFAFDDNFDNTAHDASRKNEYYEASVSRDVRCDVHSIQHLGQKGASMPSPYQAYSLVGTHCFKLPPEEQSHQHPLQHGTDPVLALPSLRQIVKSNPDVDFFVVGFFPEGLRVAFITVFVRSLPQGIDPKFDTVWDRFVNGTLQVRQRKLEVFMQLGPGDGLSPLAWAALKTLSAILSWTRRGEAEIPYDSTDANARMAFPGMTMNNYSETTHFGGSLQTNPSLPRNYVAVNAHMGGKGAVSNMAARLLYQRLEDGALPASTVDFTFVLEGQEEDELPERAMATMRLVQVDPLQVALPVSYSASRGAAHIDATSNQQEKPVSSSSWSTWNPFGSSTELAPQAEPNGTTPNVNEESQVGAITDETAWFIEEPHRAGVDALCEILEDVTVPVRKDGLPATVAASAAAVPSSTSLPASVRAEDMVDLSVLYNLNKSDLQRFYVASGCDLKTAAVRVVKTAAWRGLTFPIDTEVCRVELQSGQFFQQGHDRNGNPVFYFQNMCKGPWRKDVDAVVWAVVHRLERTLQRLAGVDKHSTKVTLVALMGKPFRDFNSGKNAKVEETETDTSDADGAASDKQASDANEEASSSVWSPFIMGANPRIDPAEDYYVHSNSTLVHRLVEILSQHYPERLSKALLVPSKGGSSYLSTALSLHSYVPSKRTRSKVRILKNPEDLLQHIEKDQLVTFVGGMAPVELEAFECQSN